jgi:hypothetical protein
MTGLRGLYEVAVALRGMLGDKPASAVLGSREKRLSDAVERVVLPAPVTEKIVLHSSAHGVETPVGDPDDVKGIGHANRVIEMRKVELATKSS